MNIKLLYFGSVADITGCPDENTESPGTLVELEERLVTRYPGLREINYRFSVNRKLAAGNETLNEGDEIALLPPFAGG